LAVTTDFRGVLSDLFSGQLGRKDLTGFHGYKAERPPGLLRALFFIVEPELPPPFVSASIDACSRLCKG
jgi:hypothetical protein